MDVGTFRSDSFLRSLLQAVSIVFVFHFSLIADEIFLNAEVVGGTCDEFQVHLKLVDFFL